MDGLLLGFRLVLCSCIEVAAGGTALDPEVVTHLLDRRSHGLAELTAREREVLTLMAEGRSNSAIAELLVVTERSVEKHVGNIFNKLDLPPSQDANRRVLAVLRYLEPDRAGGKPTGW